MRAFIFTIDFQHIYFCCLSYCWRSLLIFVANAFIILPCLQVSATVQRFLSGLVGLKIKRSKRRFSWQLWYGYHPLHTELIPLFHIWLSFACFTFHNSNITDLFQLKKHQNQPAIQSLTLDLSLTPLLIWLKFLVKAKHCWGIWLLHL